LVEASREGREIYYTLQMEKMKEIDLWLDQFRKIWQDRYEQLDDVLSNLQNQHDEK